MAYIAPKGTIGYQKCIYSYRYIIPKGVFLLTNAIRYYQENLTRSWYNDEI